MVSHILPYASWSSVTCSAACLTASISSESCSTRLGGGSPARARLQLALPRRLPDGIDKLGELLDTAGVALQRTRFDSDAVGQGHRLRGPGSAAGKRCSEL